MHEVCSEEVILFFRVSSETCALNRRLSSELAPAITTMHEITGDMPTKYRRGMMLWYPNFVVNKCLYTNIVKRMLMSAIEYPLRHAVGCTVDYFNFWPGQYVSRQFPSCDILFTDHVFASFDASTDCKSSIPVLRHSVH